MNNKDFINAVAARLDASPKEVQKIAKTFLNQLAEQLENGKTLSVQGFGNLEVKKKLERIVVNPTTKQRMLVPPKLVLAFKPSPVLKEKIK